MEIAYSTTNIKKQHPHQLETAAASPALYLLC